MKILSKYGGVFRCCAFAHVLCPIKVAFRTLDVWRVYQIKPSRPRTDHSAIGTEQLKCIESISRSMCALTKGIVGTHLDMILMKIALN